MSLSLEVQFAIATGPRGAHTHTRQAAQGYCVHWVPGSGWRDASEILGAWSESQARTEDRRSEVGRWPTPHRARYTQPHWAQEIDLKATEIV